MDKIREIIRLKQQTGLSHREIGRSVGVSPSVVSSVWARVREADLSHEDVGQLADPELEKLLYPDKEVDTRRAAVDTKRIHCELRSPGVTLELLHQEYLQDHPDGYKYASFCQQYRDWRARQSPSMRQVHVAGDKAFVDYSGKRPQIVDRKTGQATPVELFVGVLGASNYVYVEATATQQVSDWIGSHKRMLDFFGGVPRAIVPDQLKSGVTKSDWYEPLAQRSYAALGRHYGTVILPARPGKPKDKAKAEGAVLLAQRWILAKLRHETFFSLGELNERIAQLLRALNDTPMKKMGGKTRRQLFEELERDALSPLPQEQYVHSQWKHARVNMDYHVEYEGHHYSVPHRLLREKVELAITAKTVEIVWRGQRVASHSRSHQLGGQTTVREHMPKAHQKHAEQSPSRILEGAEKIGPNVRALTAVILQERTHPEAGYRSCLGILHLHKRYGSERLDQACKRVLNAGGRSCQSVRTALKAGVDRIEVIEAEETEVAIEHGNVRGADYYN